LIGLGVGASVYGDRMKPDPEAPNPIAAKDTLYIAEMTWMEVRDAMRAGKTTIIVPTGGLEQNGPYLETDKHQIQLKVTAKLIAEKLGNALIAPTVQFAPEGDIDPPTEHMLYPATISVSEETFRALLTDIANSLRVHGFEHILLLGDNTPNQPGMQAVAEQLTAAWAGTTNKFGKPPRIYYISDYFGNEKLNEWIAAQGVKEVDEGIHDDVRHTSVMMLYDPETVRLPQRRKAGLTTINGVSIDPPEPMIELGRKLADFQTDAAVKQIQEFIRQDQEKQALK